jgi:macrodomain Ter protein organizer (MatP/YcbG family)
MTPIAHSLFLTSENEPASRGVEEHMPMLLNQQLTIVIDARRTRMVNPTRLLREYPTGRPQ